MTAASWPRVRVLAAVVLLAALLVTGCADAEQEPCTLADVNRPAPTAMPTPVRITQPRELVGERVRLDPLPASYTPRISARRAWRELRKHRPPRGGGHDELLLGLSVIDSSHREPVWVLVASHRAQAAVPAYVHQDGKPPIFVCGFSDEHDALNATTGEGRGGGSRTSKWPRRDEPPPATAEPSPEPTPGT